MKAVDGDRGVNNRITYSVLDGDKGLFQLDPNSGVLYVRRPLDRESPLSNNGAFIIKIQVRGEPTIQLNGRKGRRVTFSPSLG